MSIVSNCSATTVPAAPDRPQVALLHDIQRLACNESVNNPSHTTFLISKPADSTCYTNTIHRTPPLMASSPYFSPRAAAWVHVCFRLSTSLPPSILVDTHHDKIFMTTSRLRAAGPHHAV